MRITGIEKKIITYVVSFKTTNEIGFDSINDVVKLYFGTLTQSEITDNYTRHMVYFKARATAKDFIRSIRFRAYKWKVSDIKVKTIEEFKPIKKVKAI